MPKAEPIDKAAILQVTGEAAALLFFIDLETDCYITSL